MRVNVSVRDGRHAKRYANKLGMMHESKGHI